MKKFFAYVLAIAGIGGGAYYIRSMPANYEPVEQVSNLEYIIQDRNEVVPVSLDVSFDLKIDGHKVVLKIDLSKVYEKHYEGTVDAKYDMSTATITTSDNNQVFIEVDQPKLVEHIDVDEEMNREDTFFFNELSIDDAEKIHQAAIEEFIRVAKEDKDIYNVGLVNLASNTEEFLKSVTGEDYKVTVVYK